MGKKRFGCREKLVLGAIAAKQRSAVRVAARPQPKTKLFRYTHKNVKVYRDSGELANVFVLKRGTKTHAFSLEKKNDDFTKLPTIDEYPYQNQPWALPGYGSYDHTPPIRRLTLEQFQIVQQYPDIFFEIADFLHTHEVLTKRLIRRGKWDKLWEQIFKDPGHAMKLLRKLRDKIARPRPIKLVSTEKLLARVHSEIKSWLREYREIKAWRDSKYYLRRVHGPEREEDIKRIVGSLAWIAEHPEAVRKAVKKWFIAHPHTKTFSIYLGSYPSADYYSYRRDRYFLEISRDGGVEVRIRKYKRNYHLFPSCEVEDMEVYACVYS